jgi:hypothetical protein
MVRASDRIRVGMIGLGGRDQHLMDYLKANARLAGAASPPLVVKAERDQTIDQHRELPKLLPRPRAAKSATSMAATGSRHRRIWRRPGTFSRPAFVSIRTWTGFYDTKIPDGCDNHGDNFGFRPGNQVADAGASGC